MPQTRIVVADIEVLTPMDTVSRTYQASRIYYPQHPANAIEFDDAETDQRMMVFGPAIVRHRTADTGPKAPMFTAVAYYGFWLFWLLVFLGGIWVVVR